MDWQQRTVSLLGIDKAKKLNDSSVIIFGLGGVGSFVAEALVRAGVGKLTFVDKDDVDVTNINRQLIATQLTIGQSKVSVAAQRALQINPSADIVQKQEFYLPSTAQNFDLSAFDCIVDAVDTVTAKIMLATEAARLNVDIVSCMGAGNKLLPFFKVADIYDTKVCPLAKVMRKELKDRGVKKLTVVYSEEQPIAPQFAQKTADGKISPASISYVPASAGLTVAYAVIDKLLNRPDKA